MNFNKSEPINLLSNNGTFWSASDLHKIGEDEMKRPTFLQARHVRNQKRSALVDGRRGHLKRPCFLVNQQDKYYKICLWYTHVCKFFQGFASFSFDGVREILQQTYVVGVVIHQKVPSEENDESAEGGLSRSLLPQRWIKWIGRCALLCSFKRVLSRKKNHVLCPLFPSFVKLLFSSASMP